MEQRPTTALGFDLTRDNLQRQPCASASVPGDISLVLALVLRGHATCRSREVHVPIKRRLGCAEVISLFLSLHVQSKSAKQIGMPRYARYMNSMKKIRTNSFKIIYT